ncbi:hypothetical protein B0H11DRAFT_572448 [Mycena galericulata]|nr:hypothetical protein B0H11DRAFT_572448 [Mycena galericulata]
MHRLIITLSIFCLLGAACCQASHSLSSSPSLPTLVPSPTDPINKSYKIKSHQPFATPIHMPCNITPAEMYPRTQ